MIGFICGSFSNDKVNRITITTVARIVPTDTRDVNIDSKDERNQSVLYISG